tara:strand:- start:227 stop:1144 length:918 start_codon:yes stop_codon:yes gene_type:complete
MSAILEIKDLSKIYAGGFKALSNVNLTIQEGEIFALLGPNGAGKTTLIGIVCGILNLSSGSVAVDGFDTHKHYKQARSLIGLVPQELATDTFESVWNAVSFSRGLFGKHPNPDLIEDILKRLSLWDKKDSRILELSGGMKRRVMIAKALSHEPKILFLDEPTAGVDVELRKAMWQQVADLRASGVTIILTTHYIEEAEEMADRIGVINNGKLIITEDKKTLVQKLGKKSLSIELEKPLVSVPDSLKGYSINLSNSGYHLEFEYDSRGDGGVSAILEHVVSSGLRVKDLSTQQSSLEQIFVELVNQ